MEEGDTKKNILYVEDDKYAQDIVRRVLSRYYNVESCYDAYSALVRIKAVHFDGFLIDINLKDGMDGIKLFEMIRTSPEYVSTPAMAVTAYASESDRSEFMDRGFTAYLAKPFTIKDLTETALHIFG